MRVLVLGARGRLGGTLVSHLRSCAHEVVEHARSQGADVVAELTDQVRTSEALTRASPDAIVNLVAATDVDDCERSPHRAYLTNVRTVENVAAWMAASSRPCHLIQISTDQVYDGPGPHAEADVKLVNYYAFSKYAGELAAATVPSTVLRTNFFGPTGRAGRASLSDWIAASLGRGDHITVFEDVLFNPLSMARVAEAVDVVLRNPMRGVYNLGSRSGASKADFAFGLAEALDLPTGSMARGTSNAVKLTAYRPKDMRMDCARFESTFHMRLPTLQDEILSMRSAYAAQAQ